MGVVACLWVDAAVITGCSNRWVFTFLQRTQQQAKQLAAAMEADSDAAL